MLHVQVWEPESHGQVLRVAPFAPHKPIAQGQDQMNSPQERQAMIEEMASVKERLGAVRGHVYHAFKTQLTPAARQFMQTMHPLEAVSSSSNFFPAIPTVPQLLQVRLCLPPVQQRSCFGHGGTPVFTF